MTSVKGTSFNDNHDNLSQIALFTSSTLFSPALLTLDTFPSISRSSAMLLFFFTFFSYWLIITRGSFFCYVLQPQVEYTYNPLSWVHVSMSGGTSSCNHEIQIEFLEQADGRYIDGQNSSVFLWSIPPSVYLIRIGGMCSSPLVILHNITPWRKGDRQ